MKVKNPLSDFWCSKQTGYRLTKAEASAVFVAEFLKDVGKEYAVDKNFNKIKLGKKGATYEMVDKVGGLWRIQEKLSQKITRVRDKDMVLIKKLDYQENTLFEFYTAKHVSYNCYGPFIIDNFNTDYIVTKYKTDKKTYWGYGKTIESARAYLGIKLYDEYKDVINNIARKNEIKGK